MKKVFVNWDTDNESIPELDDVQVIPDEISDDEISDYLSDTFGWCVESWYEVTETYYQPEIYTDDGTNIDWNLPNGLNSFDVFASIEECENWLEDNDYDVKDCVIHEYYNDDIEEHVYVK